jgi:hypothetical protein
MSPCLDNSTLLLQPRFIQITQWQTLAIFKWWWFYNHAEWRTCAFIVTLTKVSKEILGKQLEVCYGFRGPDERERITERQEFHILSHVETETK